MTTDEAALVTTVVASSTTASTDAQAFCTRLNTASMTHTFGLYWHDAERWVVIAVPRHRAEKGTDLCGQD